MQIVVISETTFASTHTKLTVALKAIRRNFSQDKSNLGIKNLMVCRRALGKGYSWLVEDCLRLSYQSWVLLGTRATQPTLPAGPTSTTTVPTLGWQRWVLYSDYWMLQRGRGKLFLSVRYRIYIQPDDHQPSLSSIFTSYHLFPAWGKMLSARWPISAMFSSNKIS